MGAPVEEGGVRGLHFTTTALARSAWKRASDAGHNMVGPGTILPDVPEGLAVAFNVVRIDSRPMSEGGEVYPIRGGGNMVGLGKTALMKLSAVAGINWSSDQSGRLDAGTDDRYVHWRATGWLHDPFTNRVRWFVGEKVLDVRPGSSLYRTYLGEARRKAQKDLPKNASAEEINARALDGLRRRLEELTPHLTSHAETKAQLRGIRQVLALHTAYPKAQLDKPFIVPLLVSAPETIRDPVLRERMMERRIEAAMGLGAALYGGPMRSQLASQGGMRVDTPLPAPIPVPSEPSNEPVDDDDLVDGE